jgi:hypothetical protein
MSFNNLLSNYSQTQEFVLTSTISGSSPISMGCQTTGAQPLTIIWPNTIPTMGQYLSVAGVVGSNVVLTWATGGGGSFDAVPSSAPQKPTVRVAAVPSVAIIEKK